GSGCGAEARGREASGLMTSRPLIDEHRSHVRRAVGSVMAASYRIVVVPSLDGPGARTIDATRPGGVLTLMLAADYCGPRPSPSVARGALTLAQNHGRLAPDARFIGRITYPPAPRRLTVLVDGATYDAETWANPARTEPTEKVTAPRTPEPSIKANTWTT